MLRFILGPVMQHLFLVCAEKFTSALGVAKIKSHFLGTFNWDRVLAFSFLFVISEGIDVWFGVVLCKCKPGMPLSVLCDVSLIAAGVFNGFD